MKKILLAVSLLSFALAGSAAAADLKLKVVDKEPPREVSGPIRALISPKAFQLLDGESPVYEFWWVKELTLQSKPGSVAKTMDAFRQTALLGVVSVPKALRDYRDDDLVAGVYTLRFALQPTDGNHLGTAEFPYFALLVPAKADLSVEGIPTYKALTKASSKETTTDHPVLLSLRPAASEVTEPKLNEPAPEHKSLRVAVPAKAGEEKTSASFEIVYEGKGKK
jgi:hypothetical protein